jgi:hypothetical protein
LAAFQACAAASLGRGTPTPELSSVLRLLGAFRPADTAGAGTDTGGRGGDTAGRIGVDAAGGGDADTAGGHADTAGKGQSDTARRGAEFDTAGKDGANTAGRGADADTGGGGACGWRSVLDVCLLFPADAAAVDIRALIAFATANRMLRRVHVLPVLTPTLPSPGVSVEAIPEGAGGQAAGGSAADSAGERRGVSSGTTGREDDTAGGHSLLRTPTRDATGQKDQQEGSPPPRVGIALAPRTASLEDSSELLSGRATSDPSLPEMISRAAGASAAANTGWGRTAADTAGGGAAADTGGGLAAAQWRKVCDGYRTMDHVCCELGMPLGAAEELLAEACPSIVWLRK